MGHPEMSEEKRSEFISRCYASTHRLQQLLTDVSLLTRMEDGKQSIVYERVDISEVIRIATDYRREAANINGLMILNDATEIAIIDGNRLLLESIFFNLIDNAISYSGGDKIVIRSIPLSGDRLLITLYDNGVGVAEKHLPHLFERFYRIDKGRSRAAGGTGLGLSIVKNSVQLHGGSISVCNRPDGGLCFNITFKTLDFTKDK